MPRGRFLLPQKSDGMRTDARVAHPPPYPGLVATDFHHRFTRRLRRTSTFSHQPHRGHRVHAMRLPAHGLARVVLPAVARHHRRAVAPCLMLDRMDARSRCIWPCTRLATWCSRGCSADKRPALPQLTFPSDNSYLHSRRGARSLRSNLPLFSFPSGGGVGSLPRRRRALVMPTFISAMPSSGAACGSSCNLARMRVLLRPYEFRLAHAPLMPSACSRAGGRAACPRRLARNCAAPPAPGRARTPPCSWRA